MTRTNQVCVSEEDSEFDNSYTSRRVYFGQQEYAGRTRIQMTSRHTAIDLQGAHHCLEDTTRHLMFCMEGVGLGGVLDCDSQFTILSPPSFDGPQL